MATFMEKDVLIEVISSVVASVAYTVDIEIQMLLHYFGYKVSCMG